MKKVIAFVLSASMCLSLLSVLTPAFAYEQSGEQVAKVRMVGPEDEDPENESFESIEDWPKISKVIPISLLALFIKTLKLALSPITFIK